MVSEELGLDWIERKKDMLKDRLFSLNQIENVDINSVKFTTTPMSQSRNEFLKLELDSIRKFMQCLVNDQASKLAIRELFWVKKIQTFGK